MWQFHVNKKKEGALCIEEVHRNIREWCLLGLNSFECLTVLSKNNAPRGGELRPASAFALLH
jgi:hypothetical protein